MQCRGRIFTVLTAIFDLKYTFLFIGSLDWCYGIVACLIIYLVAHFASFINLGSIFEMSFKQVSRGCNSILNNISYNTFSKFLLSSEQVNEGL